MVADVFDRTKGPASGRNGVPIAGVSAGPPETKFTVEMIFRMTPEDLARPACDLDNFAKPVLDTLFTSQNVSRLTGVLLPEVNDTWVFRLLLEKVEVKTPQEQGADLTVTWHPSVTPDPDDLGIPAKPLV